MKLTINTQKLQSAIDLITAANSGSREDQLVDWLVEDSKLKLVCRSQSLVVTTLDVENDQHEAHKFATHLFKFDRILDPFDEHEFVQLNVGAAFAEIKAPKLNGRISLLESTEFIGDIDIHMQPFAVVQLKILQRVVGEMVRVTSTYIDDRGLGYVEISAYADKGYLFLFATDGITCGSREISNEAKRDGVAIVEAQILHRILREYDGQSDTVLLGSRGNSLAIGIPGHFVSIPTVSRAIKHHDFVMRALVTSRHRTIIMQRKELIAAVKSAASVVRRTAIVEIDFSKWAVSVSTCQHPMAYPDRQLITDRISKEVEFEIENNEEWQDDEIVTGHYNAQSLSDILMAAETDSISVLVAGKSDSLTIMDDDVDNEIGGVFAIAPLGVLPNG